MSIYKHEMSHSALSYSLCQRVSGNSLKRKLMSFLRLPGAVLALAALTCFAAPPKQELVLTKAGVPPILRLGSKAPPFDLLGVDGKMHSIKDYASAKVLVVAFMCDHCPVSQMYEHRLMQITSEYKNRGVAVVAIMGNDPKAIPLPEMHHSDLGDTYQDMKLRAAYQHFNYPYLYDGDTQAVALKYGPTATPDVFVFGPHRRLRYEGRIDNSMQVKFVTKHYLRDAINDILAGKPIAVKKTPAVGCSTKWAYKENDVRALRRKLNAKPVTLSLVTAAQLRALRENKGTGKLLLVNFWATWCGPCVAEFPQIEKMVRMYVSGDRPLNIVTVSLNDPSAKNLVLNFLKKQHAYNKNLIWDTHDSSEAVKAFGTGWSGGVPYTVLIGTKGKVLFRHQGGMDALKVRREILKHFPDDRYIGAHAYWNNEYALE